MSINAIIRIFARCSSANPRFNANHKIHLTCSLFSTLVRYISFLIILFTSTIAYAQPKEYFLSGMVRDSLSMEPLPYASIMLVDGKSGTLTDARGIFGMSVPMDAKALTVTCLGYDKKTVTVKYGPTNLYDLYLSPSTIELHEVVVHKKKYSKKNNPAVDFVRKLKENRHLTDPCRNESYEYTSNQHITLAINDFTKKNENSSLYRRFPFIWDYVDTSEVSGKPILNLISHDKTVRTTFINHGKSRKDSILAQHSVGIDEVADVSSMRTFYEDVLGEINLYDNDINLLQNRFVSPLSRIAPDFYRFYLTDTVQVEDEKCIVLSFYPRNSATFGFIGQIYVPADNPAMPIRRISMRTAPDINLNFIQTLHISQKFATAEDGSSLKVNDDITIEARIAPGTPGIYCRRQADYYDFAINMRQPAMLVSPTLATAALSDSVPSASDSVASLLTRMRKVPVFYWGEKILKVLVGGYVPTGSPSKFDFGPVNTLVSHNSYEGWRFRLGGMTMAALSPRLFSKGYVAYGVNDNKFKYSGELEYSFIDKNQHSREFPIRSVRATYTYDLDHIGQHYLFTNSDNVFLSLQRMSDKHVAYRRYAEMLFTWEFDNHFSISASASSERLTPTPGLLFISGEGMNFSHLNTNGFAISLRYGKGEKFYQGRSYRIPINQDAPIFMLTHTFAPRSAFGNNFGLNKTEISVQKRFWFSAFGYADIMVEGTHIWGKTAFTGLSIPNANLSYTIQPESFALMNPMEFITDTSGSLFFTYNANGAIFNYIPFLKKLRLREVVSTAMFMGSLSHKNVPTHNPELLRFPTATSDASHTPYIELSAGLDNIFSCIRLDYVWRLTHRNPSYPIDRQGIRLAFHMTF